MLDVLAAEHSSFARRIAGYDVDPPTPARDVIDRRAELGYVQRMPWSEQHVDRRDQQDVLVIALSAVTAMNGSSDSSRYLEMPP